MCTLFIYKDNSRSNWPLMLATNRDEYLNRPFKSPGFHWKKFPSIFGGKDMKTLFITAGKTLWQVRTKIEGYALWPKAE